MFQLSPPPIQKKMDTRVKPAHDGFYLCEGASTHSVILDRIQDPGRCLKLDSDLRQNDEFVYLKPPSPLVGEERGEGSFLCTFPLIPSHQGRGKKYSNFDRIWKTGSRIKSGMTAIIIEGIVC
jgi:hypothetical protein